MKSKKNSKIKNKTRKNSLKTEKEIKEALLHLEDQYRKAIISEKDYKALKEKYSKELNKMKTMVKKDPPKEKKEEKKDKLEVGEIEEVTPEVIEKLATQLSEQPETEEEEEKKKPGIFGKIFGKKKKGTKKTSSAPISEETMTEETDEETESKPRYVSDNTAFMRWSTEMEKTPKVIDSDFLNRNRHRIIDINKFLPLSNITNPRMIKLSRLRRMNMQLSQDAGLVDLAEETVLDNVADYQMSRGNQGFYQKALITQRREWKESSDREKKTGLLKNILRGRKQQEQVEQAEGE